MRLHTDMWARQRKALLKATPTAADTAVAVRAASLSAGGSPVLTQQPPFVTGGALYPHQLAGVNWLRGAWARGQHAVLADEAGLGKTATIVTYLQTLL